MWDLSIIHRNIAVVERIGYAPRVEAMAQLVHAMSVCFAASSHPRTLIPRLARSLAPCLPLVELEGVFLDNRDQQALIRATETRDGRHWSGSRSARFFHRNYVWAPAWADYPDPARVASIPVEAQLLVPVGRRAMLRISFAADIRRSEQFSSSTDMIMELIGDHARRLGQLLDAGYVAHEAHRNNVGQVQADRRESAPESEISVERLERDATEIKVEPLDDAIVRCISAALSATDGQIYGDAGAAKLLGLKPSTLQSKMRKLGIERSAFVPDPDQA